MQPNEPDFYLCPKPDAIPDSCRATSRNVWRMIGSLARMLRRRDRKERREALELRTRLRALRPLWLDSSAP